MPSITSQREKGWKYKLAITGSPRAVAQRRSDLCHREVREGVWIVSSVVIPSPPDRLHKQYDEERSECRRTSATPRGPDTRRHVVLVFVDRLDLADARALQYARMLDPTKLRAVHSC